MLDKNLKIFRKSLKLTQDEFAKPLGLTGSYISDVERGKSDLSEPVLILIEVIFRINRIWLKTGKGDRYLKEASFIKDPKEGYRLHGDPPVFSWETFCEVPEGLDFPKTIDLLADIFRSKDEEAINAVKSNISQIARGIELDSKLVALSERMDEAEKNIS